MLVAGTSLYGFFVAYYIFARLLQNQERWQSLFAWQSTFLKHHGQPTTGADHERKASEVDKRAILINALLLAATGAFLVLLSSYIDFVQRGGDSGVAGVFYGFYGLFYIVGGFFAFIAITNLVDMWRSLKARWPFLRSLKEEVEGEAEGEEE